MTFEDLKKANSTISTMGIEKKDKKTGRVTVKEYAEVNQRIKAFRMLYPEGCIETELLSFVDGVCVFKASVKDNDGKVLGTGTAYEKEGSTFINSTSAIENCETSAVGRALAMCGIGIDLSIASYEEVSNAMLNQQEGNGQMKMPMLDEPKEVKKNDSKVEVPKPVLTDREKMLEVAKAHYPEGSQAAEALLALWNIKSLEEASDAQLQVVFNKYGK